MFFFFEGIFLFFMIVELVFRLSARGSTIYDWQKPCLLFFSFMFYPRSLFFYFSKQYLELCKCHRLGARSKKSVSNRNVQYAFFPVDVFMFKKSHNCFLLLLILRKLFFLKLFANCFFA